MQRKGFLSISLYILSLFIILNFSACRKQASTSVLYNITKSVEDDSAMVVTAHPLATEIGIRILREGGNAVDAAIAVQFALAVCYPGAGNIGGGGFMLYRSADGQTGKRAWAAPRSQPEKAKPLRISDLPAPDTTAKGWRL